MSHLADAPILKTRHQFHRSKSTLPVQRAHLVDSLEDASSSSSSSSHSSPSRRYQPYQPRPVVLRALRLPQIAKRHAAPRPLDLEPPREGPQFFNLLPKRAPVTFGEETFDVDENTDCREFVEKYEGSEAPGSVRRRCGVAVIEAREAAPATSRRTTTSSTRTPSSTTTARARRVAAQPVAGAARVAAVSLTANRSNPAAIESNVSEIFSEAASIISSRSSSRAALATSVDQVFSSAASVISSRRVAATATTRPTTSTTSSSSSSSPSLAPTTSTSSQASSTTSRNTSSAPTSSSSSSPAAASTGKSHRVRDIVVPSVVIPIGLLLLFLVGFFCWKKRKRRNAAGGRGGLGPISGPRPLRLAGGTYGAAGAAAGLGAGSAAMAAAGRGGNGSNETLGTTPSAIGVAVSEPRSKWGRRSLLEALAGGVAGSSSSASNSSPVPSRGGGALHSRQESITSSLDRGTGGYNSKGGYRPGMPRPFSPVQAQDPFTELMPTIVPVPPASQRPSSLSSASDQSLYNRSHGSNESATARLARPITSGYPLFETATTPGVESRTSTEGEQGYWTADAGINSSREAGVDDPYRYGGAGIGEDEEEELSPEERVARVNFGSGSSNSSGGSTPVVGGSGGGTPRLGSGHGSRGYRRGDSNWWG
ncbi:hypothetical protein JCM11491_005125 [Sporobolomyces phaffii]